MANLNWNQIATPEFRGANDLFIRSNQQYQDAIKGLADTLKGVQTEVRAQNDAKILDYINQATSAEQLQSPEFRAGYQNLISSLGNEYDVQGAAKAYDGRTDVLNQRANALLDQQRLQQTIKLGDQTYNQNETKFNNEQSDRDLIQNTHAWFTATDPIVKESLLVKGIDPELAQKLQTGKLSVDALNQKIEQNAKLFPYELEQTKANTKGQQLKNQAQESENKLIGAMNNASYNAFTLANPASTWTPEQVKEVQQLGRTMEVGLNKTWGGSKVTYGQYMDSEGSKLGLTPDEIALAKAMFTRESNWKEQVTSPQNAGGVAQLTPDTAKRFGVADRNNPYQSMLGGMKYIKYLSDRYGGDTRKIAAAYNTGEGNVDKHWGTDGMGNGGGVLSPTWNSKKNPGETGRYVDTVHRLTAASIAGNGGGSIAIPDGMGGVSGRSGSVGQQSAAQIQKAYENSPQGIIDSFTKTENELKAKSFTAPSKDFGGGTYKNPTEWSTAMKGDGTNAMITNMMDVTRKTNFKFSDKAAEKKFNKNGVEDWNKLNDSQKAGVLERAYNNLVQQHGGPLGDRIWNVEDEDLVNFQKAIQAETNALIKEPKDTYHRTLDANRLNTLNRLVNQQGWSTEKAAKAMNLDTATVQRLLGVQQPKSSDPIQVAAARAGKPVNRNIFMMNPLTGQ